MNNRVNGVLRDRNANHQPFVVSETEITRNHEYGHLKDITINKWHPYKDILATGSMDGTVRLWDLDKGDQYQIVLPHNNYFKENQDILANEISDIDWNNDGSLIVTSSRHNNVVSVWTVNGGLKSELIAHKDTINNVKWNPRGSHIVSCGNDAKTIVWNAESEKCEQQMHLHSEIVETVDWKDDQVFATGSADSTIKLCKVGVDHEIATFYGHKGIILSLEWDFAAQMLASGAMDKTVKIWSSDSNNNCNDSIMTLRGHYDYVHTVHWRPNGLGLVSKNGFMIASACFQVIKIWDILRGESLYTFNLQPIPTNSKIAFSPDGKFLAAGSFSGNFNIWKVENGKLVCMIKKRNPIYDTAWNNVGNKVSFVSTGREVFVYDIRNTSRLLFTTSTRLLRV